MRAARSGFSLLETVVALTLFAGVLLGMLGAGQLILARLHDNDVRARRTLYAQSIVDSLRATACARLASGTGSNGRHNASWTLTDLLDAMRVDLSVTTTPRSGPASVSLLTTLLACPEP
jgi:Tfp pilus assembly protein PilV